MGLLKEKGKSPYSATQMQDNYLLMDKHKLNGLDENRLASIRGSGMPVIAEYADNTNIVFELTELQAYVCYMHDQFEILKNKEGSKYDKYTCDDLGVRIYFGAKKDPDIMSTTVFLVPVLEISPGSKEFFDIKEIAPLNFGHARRPPKLYEGYTGQ
jgi:hypothetical protein